jgi:Domain of unknown function (DUF4157)
MLGSAMSTNRSSQHEGQHDRQQQHGPSPSSPEARADARVEAASTLGNRGFTQLVQGGAGILPDGRAHPVVEATIARTRGAGQPLEPAQRRRFGSALGDDLGDVRVHTDSTADSLARSVQARAFATGSDVYFAEGEYNPGSPSGDELLAHELTHVVQQRGAPTAGPLTVSEPGDASEREAEAVARDFGR